MIFLQKENLAWLNEDVGIPSFLIQCHMKCDLYKVWAINLGAWVNK